MDEVEQESTNTSARPHQLDHFNKSIEKNKIDALTFANHIMEYGFKWAREVKGHPLELPTPEEMLVGLYTWLCDQLKS